MGWWQKFTTWRAFSRLQSANSSKYSAAIDYLSENWNDAILTQLISLLDRPRDVFNTVSESSTRGNIVSILGNIDHPTALLALIRYANPYTNKEMDLVRRVEKQLVKKGAATLLQILDQHDGSAFNGVFIEKAILIELLGETRDSLAVPVLLDFLRSPKAETRSRSAATLALGKIGDRSVVPALIEILEDAKLRGWALMALKDIPSAEAIDPVLAILTDHRADVFDRGQAALVLGLIGDSRAVPALILALYDTETRVFNDAHQALKTMIQSKENTLSTSDRVRIMQELVVAEKRAREGHKKAMAKLDEKYADMSNTCSRCGGTGKIVYATHWQKCPVCVGPSDFRPN